MYLLYFAMIITFVVLVGLKKAVIDLAGVDFDGLAIPFRWLDFA